ncbi:MAG: DUF4019 domain-containing protein [Candidatus Andeanibacterium colombiense]|uniref:DUF4019 domain-containing protein n=1 Tax=Candidatus Andeanibacterium colombiense TaxID=3121345 RepID=A0AAJ5X797_9SPHN|nr:MAG: DUF4019 domain-containing protein [Sphingomonadaceae bacterium]
MTAMFRTSIALAFAALLASCGMKQSMEESAAEIGHFHASLDRQAYDEIWRTTSSEFRKASTQADFEKLLAAVHRKLGAVGKSDRQGWQAGNTNGVSTTVVTMKTTFAKGDGAETFTYIREGKDLKLLGYNIQSAALTYN